MQTIDDLRNNPAEFGFDGGEVVTDGDTDAHNGPYYAAVAISDCVVNTSTLGGKWTGNLNGLAIPAGLPLIMDIVSITLTSGSMVLYRSAPKPPIAS